MRQKGGTRQNCSVCISLCGFCLIRLLWASVFGYYPEEHDEVPGDGSGMTGRMMATGCRGWTGHREQSPSAPATSKSLNRPRLLNPDRPLHQPGFLNKGLALRIPCLAQPLAHLAQPPTTHYALTSLVAKSKPGVRRLMGVRNPGWNSLLVAVLIRLSRIEPHSARLFSDRRSSTFRMPPLCL